MISIITSLAKLLFVAAVVPVIVLLVYVYRKDRLEPEPPRLLFSLVLWGGLSTIGAIILESIGEEILANMEFSGEASYNFWLYFIVVALSEEGVKYIALRKRTWKSADFNCIFDGVIYAVFVSLGFALVENIKYVYSYGLSTAIIRAFTAVPGHACFGVFMGVFYGLARKYKNTEDHEVSRFCSVLAFTAPAVVHGIYDFAATTSGGLVFIGVVLGLMIVSVKMVKRVSNNDDYIA